MSSLLDSHESSGVSKGAAGSVEASASIRAPAEAAEVSWPCRLKTRSEGDRP
jgi:hypothetical protein